jgi:hypothetical protein
MVKRKLHISPLEIQPEVHCLSLKDFKMQLFHLQVGCETAHQHLIGKEQQLQVDSELLTPACFLITM